MSTPISARPEYATENAAGPSADAVPPGGTAPPFEIAEAIAAAAGGPVIVEDASFRVLGYSAFVGPMDRGRAEAILGRRIPDAWLDHLAGTGSLDRLRSTNDVVDLRDGPWRARRRLITAFRAGTRLLGFAWLAEGDHPLGDAAAHALRRSVDEATPTLLRHLEQIDVEEEHRFRQAAALLDGLPSAPAAADRLGFERNGRFVVLSASVPTRPGALDPAGDTAQARQLEHLRLCLDSFRRRAVVAPAGDGGLAVVALGPDDSAETMTRLGHEVVRLAGQGPLRSLRVAVSSVGAGLAALPRLREEATSAALVTRGDGDGGCVAFADVEAEVLVADVVARLAPTAGLSGLARLRDVDRANGGELERTLRAYLASCGSASATARELGVHVTTVRHRLDRATAVSGLRLDNPDVRIACDLLLRRPTR